MVAPKIIDMNAHYYDFEFLGLGFMDLKALFEQDNGEAFKAKIAAINTAYSSAYLASSKSATEVTNYLKDVSKWDGVDISTIPIGKGKSTNGIVQIAEVKTDPSSLDPSTNRHRRRSTALMYDLSMTEEEFTARVDFPERKPFFHSFNGTYTPVAGWTFTLGSQPRSNSSNLTPRSGPTKATSRCSVMRCPS